MIGTGVPTPIILHRCEVSEGDRSPECRCQWMEFTTWSDPMGTHFYPAGTVVTDICNPCWSRFMPKRKCGNKRKGEGK